MSEANAGLRLTEQAPAKINLSLFVGPTREHDGRHELVTVFQPLALADTVTLTPAGGGEDEVVCPGVSGPNLAARALAAFREATGWDGPPVRLEIDKRIPVAGGMAGGSADAAAALRLARRASGMGDDALLHDLAMSLGADVPGQLEPVRLLATGAGEHLRRLPPPPAPLGVLVLPSTEQLSTGAVFAEADRLGLARDAAGLADALADVERALATGEPPIVNDLSPAALALCAPVGEALAAVAEAGAQETMVSGSGPTVVGLFATPADAERATARLAGRHPAPIATRTLP